MERGKNNTSLVVIITVLAMCVVGLGGYVVYDKVLKKEPIKQETPKDKEEEKEIEEELIITSDQVQKLYSYVTMPTTLTDVLYAQCKLIGTKTDYFIKQKEVMSENIEDEIKLYIAISELKKEDFKETERTSETSLKVYELASNRINELVDKIFHSTLKSPEKIAKISVVLPVKLLTNDGFETTTAMASYNAETKNFDIAVGGGVGGACGEITTIAYTKLIRASKKGDTIQLEARLFIVDYNEKTRETYNVYKDFEKTNLIKENQLAKNLNPGDYYNTASRVFYTFQKGNDGNYYFKSSKVSE